MLVLVFTYDAREPEEFEQIYGPEGEWARFFRRGVGFVGTELLRDVEIDRRYVVIDRWDSVEAYGAFIAEHRAEYMRRVDDTAFYYDQELRLGTFENAW